MYIKFGWGKNPTSDELTYEVESYSFAAASRNGFLLGNLIPQTITMTLVVEEDLTDPGKDVFEFAQTQHETHVSDGCGKIVVFQDEESNRPLQSISFMKSYISDLTFSPQSEESGVSFRITLTVQAQEVEISGITLKRFAGRSSKRK